MADEPAFTFPQPKVPDLKAAIRRARIEEAERSAASADLRAGELARLDLLREALVPLYEQLPPGADMFDLALVPGEKPRLFVDIVAHVEMSRDGKTYRLLQTLRTGRMLLLETGDPSAVVDAVAAYLGRRLTEREKALAADLLPPPAPQAEAPAAPSASEPAAMPAPRQPAPRVLRQEEDEEPGARRFSGGDVAFMFLLGLILGAAALYGLGLLQARGVALPFSLPSALSRIFPGGGS
ncbi:MAG: hypothetical protein U1E62_02685 [Alsobacter sp.]